MTNLWISSSVMMLTLIIVAKIISQEQKIRILELLLAGGITLVVGGLYSWSSPLFPLVIRSAILYFIFPLIVMLSMIIKGMVLKKSVLFSAISGIIWIIAEFFVWFIWSITRTNPATISTNELLLVTPIMVISSILIAVLIVYAGRSLIKKLDESPTVQQISAILAVVFLLVINLMISNFEMIYNNIETSTLILVVFALFFTILLSGLTGIILHLRKLNIEYTLKEKEQSEIAMLYYIQEIEKQSTEIRKFKHDYQNILLSMDGYLVRKDWDGLITYFSEEIKGDAPTFLNDDLKLNDLNKLTIQAVKSILAFKIMVAKQLKITISFEANHIVEQLRINVVDLVRIIGILMDNAIEAISDLAVKKLRIGLLKEDNCTLLIISNTCPPEVAKIHEMKKRGFSTKGENRGLGLSNLDELVAKYDHVFSETVIKDGWFIQVIRIDEND